jgi:hypothetical protein
MDAGAISHEKQQNAYVKKEKRKTWLYVLRDNASSCHFYGTLISMNQAVANTELTITTQGTPSIPKWKSL